jgi:hypothetical protein
MVIRTEIDDKIKKGIMEKLKKTIKEGIAIGGMEMTSEFVDSIKANLASHSVTGMMINSIRISPVLKQDIEQFVVIVNDPAAIFLEEGTKGPYKALPPKDKIQPYADAYGVDVEWLRRKLAKEGTEGIHFMANAEEDMKSKAGSIMEKNIISRLQTLKG